MTYFENIYPFKILACADLFCVPISATETGRLNACAVQTQHFVNLLAPRRRFLHSDGAFQELTGGLIHVRTTLITDVNAPQVLKRSCEEEDSIGWVLPQSVTVG